MSPHVLRLLLLPAAYRETSQETHAALDTLIETGSDSLRETTPAEQESDSEGTDLVGCQELRRRWKSLGRLVALGLPRCSAAPPCGHVQTRPMAGSPLVGPELSPAHYAHLAHKTRHGAAADYLILDEEAGIEGLSKALGPVGILPQ